MSEQRRLILGNRPLSGANPALNGHPISTEAQERGLLGVIIAAHRSRSKNFCGDVENGHPDPTYQ
jgi:hypothetical protein